ncbi:MAG: M15 family metallopeptidase, partial [Stenotrophomonas sp.]
MTTRTCSSAVSAIAPSLLLLALAVSAAHAQAVTIVPVGSPEEAGMVDVRTLAPSIDQDIRYAGSNNFTGRPVPGYEAAKCYLLAPAAQALAKVEAQLRADGYALQLFDCYRPAQSVHAFVTWAHDPREQSRKVLQYPDLDKPQLLGGYIAETSGHSRGAT